MNARRRQGVTLIEVIVSVLILGTLATAVMTAVAGSKRAAIKTSDLTLGSALAESQLNEVLALPYSDPDGSPVFGLESGESGSDRTAHDDVDDFHGLNESPPKGRDGAVVSGGTGWTRTVTLQYVDKNNHSVTSGSDTGVKKITVSVNRGAVFSYTLTAIRTAGWTDEITELRVAIVVNDPDNPSAGVRTRMAMFTEWGFLPTLMSASASQAEFDAAAETTQLFYIPQETTDSGVGTKLRGSTAGVANECPSLTDELGISSINPLPGLDLGLSIATAAHPITANFSTGLLNIFSLGVNVNSFTLGGLAGGADTLARSTLLIPSLVAIETGGALSGGGTASARRVQLPFGDDSFVNPGNWLVSGREMCYRAIVWTAEGEL